MVDEGGHLMYFNTEGGAMQAARSHSPSWVASIIAMKSARSKKLMSSKPLAMIL